MTQGSGRVERNQYTRLQSLHTMNADRGHRVLGEQSASEGGLRNATKTSL